MLTGSKDNWPDRAGDGRGLVLIGEVVIVGVGEDFEHGTLGGHLERASPCTVVLGDDVLDDTIKTDARTLVVNGNDTEVDGGAAGYLCIVAKGLPVLIGDGGRAVAILVGDKAVGAWLSLLLGATTSRLLSTTACVGVGVGTTTRLRAAVVVVLVLLGSGASARAVRGLLYACVGRGVIVWITAIVRGGLVATLPRDALGERQLYGLRDGGTDAALGTGHVEHVGSGYLDDVAIIVYLVLHTAADLRIDGEQVAELHTVAAKHVTLGDTHVAREDGVDQLGRDAETFDYFVSQVLKFEGAEADGLGVIGMGAQRFVLLYGILNNCHSG